MSPRQILAQQCGRPARGRCRPRPRRPPRHGRRPVRRPRVRSSTCPATWELRLPWSPGCRPRR